MKKSDYEILKILKDKQATDKLSAMSVLELSEYLSFSKAKIYYSIKVLLSESLIDVGIRDENKNTTYINENGINALSEIE